ncbi:MAG: proteinral transcription repressor, partial [Tremellales sp. Tagirdzhanova-0007]
MQPPGIYNHHRLATTSAPSANASALSGSSSARVNEFLELIRNEYETVSQDGNIWKAQRDEYETKIQQQVSELGLIRQSLYELEATHAKIRQEYQ